ncbi:MAG TPA: hypothetical protein VHG91_05025, partial [Longimicrobium sp.]|nr:hypothetical protein [Longimicrobium sp.]
MTRSIHPPTSPQQGTRVHGPAGEPPPLAAGERARTAHGWNGPARAFPAETLHARFEAWADRTPGAP